MWIINFHQSASLQVNHQWQWQQVIEIFIVQNNENCANRNRSFNPAAAFLACCYYSKPSACCPNVNSVASRNRLIGADHRPWLIIIFIIQFSHVIHQPIQPYLNIFYLLTMSVMWKASLRIFTHL
jgi:hypothetical protein